MSIHIYLTRAICLKDPLHRLKYTADHNAHFIKIIADTCPAILYRHTFMCMYSHWHTQYIDIHLYAHAPTHTHTHTHNDNYILTCYLLSYAMMWDQQQTIHYINNTNNITIACTYHIVGYFQGGNSHGLIYSQLFKGNFSQNVTDCQRHLLKGKHFEGKFSLN